jgi:hypothetical protein
MNILEVQHHFIKFSPQNLQKRVDTQIIYLTNESIEENENKKKIKQDKNSKSTKTLKPKL